MLVLLKKEKNKLALDRRVFGEKNRSDNIVYFVFWTYQPVWHEPVCRPEPISVVLNRFTPRFFKNGHKLTIY